MAKSESVSLPQSNAMSKTTHDKSLAAVILCGGRSRRMGTDKAGLTFGEESLLHRVCRLTLGAANPVVVVAAPDQKLPALPDDVHLVRDLFPGEGPVGGVLTTLNAIG